MSRTEGILLPRLPTTHTRVTSPASIQPTSRWQLEKRARSFSEPHHTAYIGTPRQDVPSSVYFNAVQFDDVFDKEGKLLGSRNTPKITCPLNALEYNSLHDPHCRRLFLNNGRLREHLMNLGLITNDLKVVATTKEQQQKIRAHELIERREQLLQKMERREEERLQKLQNAVKVPQSYAENLINAEARRLVQSKIKDIKLEKALAAEKKRKREEDKKHREERRKLKVAIEEAQLLEQAKRNAAAAEQEMAEVAAYEKQYGKYGHLVARWHRDSDMIHNRMAILEHTKWARMRRHPAVDEHKASPPQNPTSDMKSRTVPTATPPASPVPSLPSLTSAANTPSAMKHVSLQQGGLTKTTTTDDAAPTHNTLLAGQLENHQPREPQLLMLASKTSDAKQETRGEVIVQSLAVAMQYEHHENDTPAHDHYHGSDLTRHDGTVPSQGATTNGLGASSDTREEPTKELPAPRDGRLSVIEEASELSESGEQPEGIQENKDIQEDPGDIQEVPRGAQESPEYQHLKEARAENLVKQTNLGVEREAWVETKQQTESENVGEVTAVPLEPAKLEEPANLVQLERVILDKDQSMMELTSILVEALEQADARHQGFISSSDFGQILQSYSLGLDLDQNEVNYIMEEADVYKNGWIPFIQIAPYLPEMLMTIYGHRAELEMQQFGAYTEEQWCQIISPTYGELFLSKITGTIQNWRPDNFRPFLKDDVFEDSVVQYFHQADSNGDGEVDDDEFRNFLMSPEISQSIYQSQLEELYDLSHSYSSDGRMNLEIFAVVVRSLILMIYQNTYPSEEEWIRIQSRKFGDFSLNKRTGEMLLAEPSLPLTTSELIAGNPPQTPAAASTQETELGPNLAQPKQSKKTKKHRKKKSSGSPQLSERTTSKDLTPPPLLRRRTPKVTEGTSEGVAGTSEGVSGNRLSATGSTLPLNTATPQLAQVPTPPGNIGELTVPTTPGNVEELTVPTTPGNIGELTVPTTPGNVEELTVPTTPGNVEELTDYPQLIHQDKNKMGESQVPAMSDSIEELVISPSEGNDHPQLTGGDDKHPQLPGVDENHHQFADRDDEHPRPAGRDDNHPQPDDRDDNHPQPDGGDDNHPQPDGRDDNHPQPDGEDDSHPQPDGGDDNHPHPAGEDDNHPHPADNPADNK